MLRFSSFLTKTTFLIFYSATFKHNIAENRLKALQTNLKKEQSLKSQLFAENQLPPAKKLIRSSNDSTKHDNRSSLSTTLLNNNNKEVAAKLIKNETTHATNALSKTSSTETAIMAKYRQFVAQLHTAKTSHTNVNDKRDTKDNNNSIVSNKITDGTSNSTILGGKFHSRTVLSLLIFILQIL